METFCLPLHEINERFTKSELFIVAWRSQEVHHHMKLKMRNIPQDGDAPSTGHRRSRYSSTDIIPEGLPEKFYAQDVVRDKFGKVMASPGEINLSQVTGVEARKYMAAIGMHFPEIQTVVPKP